MVETKEKEFCSTNGHIKDASVHLVSEPFYTANLTLLPKVNLVRKRRSLTSCAEYGFRLPSLSALNGNNHQLKSVSFSNGVKKITFRSKYEKLKLTLRLCFLRQAQDTSKDTERSRSAGSILTHSINSGSVPSIIEGLSFAEGLKTKYYNPDIHFASMGLPDYITEKMR